MKRLLPLSLLACLGMLLSVTGVQAAPAPDNAAGSDSARVGASNTRFGTSLFALPGETWHDAFLRQQRTYGRLGAVRLFHSKQPGGWETIKEHVGQTPVVVSFKMNPAHVVAGLFDMQMLEWFSQAPTDRVTWWSYYHEPENDVAKEKLDTEIYKLAWQHLAALADHVGNPQLRATLILMCWTTEPQSGRNWRDYYPGALAIDVLAFDCYNSAYRSGRYRAPRDLFIKITEIATNTGKPWGIAELGSVLVSGDRGLGRSEWLRRSARFLRANGAVFCTYFDSDIGVDYRLRDTPSRRAWRDVVHAQYG
jgi:hypothetical protein